MAGDTYHGPTAWQQGDHNVQHNHFHQPARPARRPAPWPHQVGVMPARAECFQDRAEAARLRHALSGGGTAVVGQARPALPGGVLAGLGGVGKTQLAADYARSALLAGELDVLVWLVAGTRSAVVDAYARAAVEVLGADPGDPESAAAAFLAWLEPKAAAGERPCRWLVVLDDVADPAVLKGLWPPPSPLGRTLVTTRRRDAALTGPGRRRIEVGEFTAGEAADYLTAVLAAHGRGEPAADVAALAGDVGRLPLALSQAAAYVIDAGISCAAYRTLLADRARTLGELSPDVLPDGQDHTMAAAWSLSVDYADRLRPVGLARPMLHLAAFLDPNGIPAAVLAAAPALEYLAARRRGRAPVSARDADAALRALHRLSLLDAPAARDGTGYVRVHQIVQRATRDTLSRKHHARAARTAADALVAAWPDPECDRVVAEALRACTTALAACAEAALHEPDVHRVLFRAGHSLGDAGQVVAARNHFQRLSDTTGRYLGPDHPTTLGARGSLAEFQGAAGDAAGAAAALAGVLRDRLRVLAPDDPDTLRTRNNLATWWGRAGDAARAAAAFADLLDDVVSVLGPDHPDTLTTRNNLATWQAHAGDTAGAAAAFADLVADRTRLLGPDHPSTLTARNNLANWLGESGDAAGAAAAFTDLLADRTRVLGPQHPMVLVTRSNLAEWQGEAGDAVGAAAAFADLLPDAVSVLGPDHPDTLVFRNNLANWQGRAGDAAAAATSFAGLLADMLAVLGPDHPSTLTARNNLANWLGASGDPAGAAADLTELLRVRRRVLGPDHPDTLRTRDNLAHWRRQLAEGTGSALPKRD